MKHARIALMITIMKLINCLESGVRALSGPVLKSGLVVYVSLLKGTFNYDVTQLRGGDISTVLYLFPC